MSQTRTKVFHLEMNGEHYYFGSPKAMFDIMGEETMGMRYASFHSNISLKIGDVYKNRRNGYIIRVGVLGQAKTNRGNKLTERINERVAAALAQHGITQAAPNVEQQAETAPVQQETPAPVQQETTAPVQQETPAPVQQETPAPVQQETTAPVQQETPAPVQPTLFDEQKEEAQQTVVEQSVKKSASKSKKKNVDIPEQLTLF